eukprot:1139173-Pelagomonas_calceolata.AAC.6
MGAEADEVELKARQNSNGNQAGGMPQMHSLHRDRALDLFLDNAAMAGCHLVTMPGVSYEECFET